VALLASHRIAVERFRMEQLNLVRTVSAQIVSLYDLDELARRVTQLIQSTFKYYYVAIFTLEAGDTKLHFRASAGARRKGKKAPALEVALGQGVIGVSAGTGDEIIANDIAKEKRFRHIASLPETRSEAVIPLKIENRVVGVLDIQSDQLHAFHPNDLLVLRALADNIAIAIEEARVYSGLERRAKDMALVAEAGRAATSILNLRKMMEKVAELIFERIGFQYVHLFTVHPIRRQIIYEAGGAKSHALEGYIFDLDDTEGIIPWVARNAETALVNDVTRDPRYHLSPLPPADAKAELCVPLIFNNEVVGILDVQADKLNAFTAEDRLLFQALGDSIAAAIHNADLYRSEQWRRQVSDSLREVAGLLSANVSLDQVLDSILTELERNLPADIAAVWLMGDDDVYCAAVHGARAADLEAVKRAYPETNTWLAKALLARKPMIRKAKDPMGPSAMAGNFNPDHSSIAAPLRIGEQAVGILSLVHHTPGRYGHEAQAMTTTFASYAAVAIENARLYDAAQEQAYASAALLQVAQAVVSLSNLEDILATIVRILPILVGVERAVLYRCDAANELFVPIQEYGLSDEALPILWRSIPKADFPLLTAAMEYGQHTLSMEAHLGPENWLKVRPVADEDIQAVLQSEDRLLMAFPLNIKEACFGVLLTEETLGGRRFRSRRIEILTGVAQQAALAIQNDLFQQESRLRERLETEVELARQIQETFIPDHLPSFASWDLASRWKTARQVGGDFYDVFELPNKHVGLFIADVADKGVPAALFMALTRTLVRAAVEQTSSPAEALSRVNRLLYPDAQQGMFVTAVYGVLDTQSGLFTYANAGHNPPLWIRHADGRAEPLPRTGIALGVLEDAQMGQRSIDLGLNDQLLFYTDGVTESFAESGEMFGEERLLEILSRRFDSASALLDAVEKTVSVFTNDAPLADDITLIALKRLS
jgi:serine phosphatase RsbU (regulator of sigma subunit)/putative methionine-R-sulfoxide reductase with GAF domain